MFLNLFLNNAKNSRQGSYSGCQKNVPFLEGFFLQPLIPPLRIAEHILKSGINWS